MPIVAFGWCSPVRGATAPPSNYLTIGTIPNFTNINIATAVTVSGTYGGSVSPPIYFALDGVSVVPTTVSASGGKYEAILGTVSVGSHAVEAVWAASIAVRTTSNTFVVAATAAGITFNAVTFDLVKIDPGIPGSYTTATGEYIDQAVLTRTYSPSGLTLPTLTDTAVDGRPGLNFTRTQQQYFFNTSVGTQVSVSGNYSMFAVVSLKTIAPAADQNTIFFVGQSAGAAANKNMLFQGASGKFAYSQGGNNAQVDSVATSASVPTGLVLLEVHHGSGQNYRVRVNADGYATKAAISANTNTAGMALLMGARLNSGSPASFLDGAVGFIGVVSGSLTDAQVSTTRVDLKNYFPSLII